MIMSRHLQGGIPRPYKEAYQGRHAGYFYAVPCLLLVDLSLLRVADVKEENGVAVSQECYVSELIGL